MVPELLTALARQASFAQAELLAGAWELAMTPWRGGDDPAGRLVELNEFSADQVAFTLTWSRGYAVDQVELAQDLIVRLPMVFAALRSGRLDLARARLFSRQLAGLADRQQPGRRQHRDRKDQVGQEPGHRMGEHEVR